jgi:pimeloyl-ACP methyl ester carboxylesterase
MKPVFSNRLRRFLLLVPRAVAALVGHSMGGLVMRDFVTRCIPLTPAPPPGVRRCAASSSSPPRTTAPKRLWGPGVEDHAQVFGYGIAVTAAAFSDPGTKAQELMHVKQIERFGSLAAFVEEYLRQSEAHGYLEAPLEREAVALYEIYAGSEVGTRLRSAAR